MAILQPRSDYNTAPLSQHEPAAPAIAIFGLGLIGGSLGMRLRSRAWQVSYVDPHVAEEKAIRVGAANRRLTALGASDADLIVLAAPLDASLSGILEAPAGRNATSVCGLMAPLIEAAGKRGLPFIAGHPMAGSEERSIDSARIDLFEGKRWFLSRAPHSPLLDRLIEDVGATADEVDPAEHDRAMLLVSHLPQLLSTALAAHLKEEMIDIERFGGSGLRTFLRLAGSPASMWEPLFLSSEPLLRPHLEAVRRHAETILSGRGGPLFEQANALWNIMVGRKP
jgi:prephenate dehydrogenase